MTRRSRFPILVIAASAAAAVTPSPAHAQCRLCDTPNTVHDETSQSDDIKLEVQTRLNFDRLIYFGQGEGTAVIRPDGSNSATGAVSDMSSRAMVGTVLVHGQAGRTIRVELPHRIELYSVSGARIVFDEVVTDLPSVPRLDPGGNLTFRFGGRVRVTGDADGDYRGDLPITVEYL
jgi:Domain of unknown function (DUF4402)